MCSDASDYMSIKNCSGSSDGCTKVSSVLKAEIYGKSSRLYLLHDYRESWLVLVVVV
jgi:hypothetical protein